MIIRRNSADRGAADHGWLQSFHSFSFSDYYDPQHMQFGPLRVINEDWIAPGMGFGTHPHRDMEIVTVVLEGVLAHKDSLGNGADINPGEVQRMSAGTGIRHSEFNASQTHKIHLLQIWIQPSQTGIAPGYEQKAFDPQSKRGRLRLLASPDGADGSVQMTADARLYGGLFDGTDSAQLRLEPGRLAYVHLARGELTVNGERLQAGDALKLVEESEVQICEGQDAEVLVFDLGAGH